MKTARHPIPNDWNFVLNKIRTESLHLFKMRVIRTHVSGMYLVGTYYLPIMQQKGTHKEGLYGTAALFILWRATCKRRETM